MGKKGRPQRKKFPYLTIRGARPKKNTRRKPQRRSMALSSGRERERLLLKGKGWWVDGFSGRSPIKKKKKKPA